MLLAVFFTVFLLSYLNGIALLRRLETAHPDVWEELGRPSLKQTNVGKPRRKLMRFVWGFHFTRQRDPRLTRYCFLALTAEAFLVVIFIALIAGVA